MSAHIEIGTTVRLGSELRSLVDSLRDVQERINKAKSVYDQLALGGDWAALAAALGIANNADAEAIYNMLGSVQGEVVTSATFTAQFLSRLG